MRLPAALAVLISVLAVSAARGRSVSVADTRSSAIDRQIAPMSPARRRAESLAEIRAGGWITYGEAVRRALPWVKPEKLAAGMNWCSSAEIKRDEGEVSVARPPLPDAPVCQVHHADSGTMVPGTRAAYEESVRQFSCSASMLGPCDAAERSPVSSQSSASFQRSILPSPAGLSAT